MHCPVKALRQGTEGICRASAVRPLIDFRMNEEHADSWAVSADLPQACSCTAALGEGPAHSSQTLHEEKEAQTPAPCPGKDSESCLLTERLLCAHLCRWEIQLMFPFSPHSNHFTDEKTKAQRGDMTT